MTAASAGRVPRGRGAVALALLLALVASLLLAGYLAYRSRHLTDEPYRPWVDSQRVVPDGDRQQAKAVAEQFALRVDGYRGSDPKGYLASVTSVLTTRFKAEFTKAFDAATKVGEAESGTDQVGEGAIVSTGVSTIDRDSAEVLVAHDNTVTSGQGATQDTSQGTSQRHHRWTVQLRKVGGTWLVDGFDAVS